MPLASVEPSPVLATHVPLPLRGNPYFFPGVVCMGVGNTRQFVLAFGITSLLVAGSALAQSSTTSENARKTKSKVAPVYPELARRMSIGGKVKLELVITPDGRVKSTRVVGGHPILVQACQDAVKDWKFVPAAEESTQVVEFDFHE